MKYISLSLFIALAMIISACSAEATQAISATTTAPSIAVTNTQVDLSTTTPIPPSPTETQPVVLATETPTEIPSLEATITATSTSSTSGNTNPCNKLLQTISGGKPAKIKIENNSGFPITVSLFLNTTPFGDCGYRGYTLGKYDSILITDLIQACYNISVLIDNPKKQIKAFDYGCINNPDKWTFIVSKDTVMLQGR